MPQPSRLLVISDFFTSLPRPEHQVFDDAQLAKMLAFARQGVQELIEKQRAVLSSSTLRTPRK